QRAALRTHFPAARLVDRALADQKVLSLLAPYPISLEFRRRNILAPKVFDFVTYLEAERMLIIDSDVLFFYEPRSLLGRIDDVTYRRNLFNADFGHGYTIEPEEAAPYIGHELLPRINSGLGLIQRASIRFDWIEEFLKLPGVLAGHFWRIEQTLIALCS